MGKEAKIGLAVIGSLLVVFGFVLYQRLTKPAEGPILANVRDNDSPSGDGAAHHRDGADRKPPASDHEARDLADPGASARRTWVRANASEGDEQSNDERSAEGRESYAPRGLPANTPAPRPDWGGPGRTESSPQSEDRAADDRWGNRDDAQAAEDDARDDAQTSDSPDPFRHRPVEGESEARLEVPSELVPADNPRFAQDHSDRPDESADGEPARPIRSLNHSVVVREVAQNEASSRRGRDFLPPDDQGESLDERRTAERGRGSSRRESGDRFAQDGRDRSSEVPERVEVENGQYTVQPNDSYWIISEKIYGTGGYFKALREHNRLKHRSDKLQVGEVLLAPPASVLAQNYPSLSPKPRRRPTTQRTALQASSRQRLGGRVYVVEQGDTLFDIARYELGKASRWAEIYNLNRETLGDDFDFLQPGTELALPSDRQDNDNMTRRDSTFQR